MYTRIIVPLDGSKLAEGVLPHLETLVLNCGRPEVILISVTEAIEIPVRSQELHPAGWAAAGSSYAMRPAQPLAPQEPPGILGKRYSQADRYLDRIQEKLARKGITSRTEVLMGKVAESIIDYAANSGADLIVMTSHGRSGIGRWTHGSVAEKVFKASCIPVLMVRA